LIIVILKTGVVVFPGSNCDQDMVHVLGEVMQQDVKLIWHKDTKLEGFGESDLIVIPGGFAYGDYLRAGAIARFSPIMDAVIEFAEKGGYVWGICNGFQILCETGLLPGALMRNHHQLFVCKNVYLKAQTSDSMLSSMTDPNAVLKIPISHAEGRYFADQTTIDKMTENNQILYKYCNENGEITAEANPNGSVENIAAICNKERNVFGMMPHPERAAELSLGNQDGRVVFESLVSTVET